MNTGLVLFSLLVVSANCLDSRWKLLWSDEFTGTFVDQSKWTVRDQAGFVNNGELGYYSPSQVTVANGTLIITSNPDSSHGTANPYATGLLDTAGKFSTTSGRIEINAKLPYGQGLWSLQWINSEYLCWPVGAEIDIMEDIGNPISQIHATYHFATSCNNNMQNESMYDTGLDLSQAFHTYAIEWNTSSVTWFFDDFAYKTITSDSVNAGQAFPLDASPHFIAINTAVGGYWPGNPDSTTVWPQYQIVDYVRVYAWEPCTTGCVHGCCQNSTALCNCNPGVFGANCEYTGDTLSSSFQAPTANDIFINNANISNVGGEDQLVLTVVNQSCPNACTGGRWSTAVGYGHGNYTFVVKSTNVPGTALLLWGWTNTGVFTGFEAGLSGGAPTTLFFQSFGQNQNLWQSVSLGFDASLTYHTYTISYGVGFQVYADGSLIISTPSAPYIPLQIAIEYYYNLDYYNNNQPFTGTLPQNVYAAAVSFTPVTGAPVVCLGSTTTTTTTTTAATTAATTTTTATAATTAATTTTASTATTAKSATTATATTATTGTATPTPTPTPTPSPSSSTTKEPSSAVALTSTFGAAMLAVVVLLIQW